jgi:hypothetical protein
MEKEETSYSQSSRPRHLEDRILAALLLPALSAAKERAYRTGCVNNFKQLGIPQFHNLKLRATLLILRPATPLPSRYAFGF